MKFAICNEIYQDWKLPDAMAHAAKAGYDAIEIAPFTIAKYVTEISSAQRQQIRDDAARAGIAVCGIHWVLVHAEGMYLNHSERRAGAGTHKPNISATSWISARMSAARSLWSARPSNAICCRAFRWRRRGIGRRKHFAIRLNALRTVSSQFASNRSPRRETGFLSTPPRTPSVSRSNFTARISKSSST